MGILKKVILLQMKKTAVFRMLHLSEKPIETKVTEVPHRTISTRVTKKEHLKNFRATNGKHII